MEILPEDFFKYLYPGFKPTKISIDENSHSMNIELVPDCQPRCPHCHSGQVVVHEYRHRCAKEANICNYFTSLGITYRTLKCKYCGATSTENISFLSDLGNKVTSRLERAVIDDLEKTSPVIDTAARFHVGWDTCKDIHKRYLQKTVYFHLGDTKILLIDEISIKRGHTYATVIADKETRRILWVGKGKTVAAVSQFFKLCGTEGCKQIKAVAMDQNAGFAKCVHHYCPKAKVVYDLFHMISGYGKNVISAIRIRLASIFKDNYDIENYQILKNSRFILLAKPENLDPRKITKLNLILENNKELYEAYVLKELLREVWNSSSKEEAEARWHNWYKLASEASAPEVRKFARNQNKRYKGGITNSGIYHIGTSILEGINNKIKVLKRIAFGYRDFEYFKLRIMNAFRGKVLPGMEMA